MLAFASDPTWASFETFPRRAEDFLQVHVDIASEVGVWGIMSVIEPGWIHPGMILKPLETFNFYLHGKDQVPWCL